MSALVLLRTKEGSFKTTSKVNLTPKPRVHCPFRLITFLLTAIILMQPSIDAAYPSQIRGVVLKFKHLVSAH